MSTPGMPMDEMLEQENATAAVNAGYFFDDGTASLAVGSVPTGLTLSHSAVVWDDGHELLPEESFVGFTTFSSLPVSPRQKMFSSKTSGMAASPVPSCWSTGSRIWRYTVRIPVIRGGQPSGSALTARCCSSVRMDECRNLSAQPMPT